MEAVSQNPNTNDGANEPGQSPRSQRSQPGYTPPYATPPSGKPGYFHIYKKGQGYWTRAGTIAGAVLIGLLTATFLYQQFDALFRNQAMENFLTRFHLQEPRAGYLLVLGFGIIYAAIIFHFTNKPRNADFLIATDSEMKRVNWTSRKELIGSTQIVIWFMIVMAVVLFLYDLLFSTIFWLIGVSPPPFH
jgi:preprotein translocase subunit SecE